MSTTENAVSDVSVSIRPNKLNLTIPSTDVNVANTLGDAFSPQVSLWGSVPEFRLLTKAADGRSHSLVTRFPPRARRVSDVSEADVLARASKITGHTFSDPSFLLTALTHSSRAPERLASNERLEFLGDAVLGMVVCEELFRRFPTWHEGDLTKVKSSVVSRRVCAEVADETSLTELLFLGNGIVGQGRLPTSLRAAVFESIIGSLLLDGGIEVAKKFILDNISTHIDKWAEDENRENFKSALQQYAQRRHCTTPYYESLDEKGPDHCKCFEVCVVIDRRRFPGAWGPSKKEAEQEAARRALDILQLENGCSESDGPD